MARTAALLSKKLCNSDNMLIKFAICNASQSQSNHFQRMFSGQQTIKKYTVRESFTSFLWIKQIKPLTNL